MAQKKEEKVVAGSIVTHPSEITLWLDEYGDIFSDFDPRTYSQRSLSVDLLRELKSASSDMNDEHIHLTFLVPEHLRKSSDETVIKRRLTEFFHKESRDIKEKVKLPLLKKGWFFVVVGIFLMFVATALFFNYNNTSLIRNFFILLVEPGGWFFLWEGLSLIVFDANKVNAEMKFYTRMANCSISFKSL